MTRDWNNDMDLCKSREEFFRTQPSGDPYMHILIDIGVYWLSLYAGEKAHADEMLSLLERIKADVDQFRDLTGFDKYDNVEEQAAAFNQLLIDLKTRAEAAERQRDEAMLALERLGKIAEKAGKSERTDVWGQTIDFISEIVDENLKRIKTNSQINPDQTPVPDIKPGDTVNVVNEIQFPFLKNVKVDHIRLHSFGKYAALEFEGELYIIPYEHLEATTEAIL